MRVENYYALRIDSGYAMCIIPIVIRWGGDTVGRREAQEAAVAVAAEDFEPDASFKAIPTRPALNQSIELVANGRLYRRVPITQKLASRTIKHENGCWLWIGRLNRRGYGVVDIGGRRENGGGSRLAHRVSYEAACGPIPPGLTLDHLCRNPACINPEHLDPVSITINVLRGGHAAQTHCKRGHPLTGDNLRMRNGARRCRACDALWNGSRRDASLRQLLQGAS